MRAELERRELEGQLRQRRRQLEKDFEDGTAPWLVRVWSKGFVGGSVGAFALGLVTGMEPSRLFDPAGPPFWVTLGAGACMATVTVGTRWREARKERRRSLEDAVAASQRDLEALRGPGWVMRTVRTGVLLGLGVGVPVGSILALGLPPSELPARSRLLALGGFTLMTMLWTLPFAFGLRWISLRAPLGRGSLPPMD